MVHLYPGQPFESYSFLYAVHIALWARHSIIIPAVVLLFIANVWNAGLLFTSSLERLIISSISWIDLIRYELGILVTEVPNEIVPQG